MRVAAGRPPQDGMFSRDLHEGDRRYEATLSFSFLDHNIRHGGQAEACPGSTHMLRQASSSGFVRVEYRCAGTSASCRRRVDMRRLYFVRYSSKHEDAVLRLEKRRQLFPGDCHSLGAAVPCQFRSCREYGRAAWDGCGRYTNLAAFDQGKCREVGRTAFRVRPLPFRARLAAQRIRVVRGSQKDCHLPAVRLSAETILGGAPRCRRSLPDPRRDFGQGLPRLPARRGQRSQKARLRRSPDRGSLGHAASS